MRTFCVDAGGKNCKAGVTPRRCSSYTPRAARALDSAACAFRPRETNMHAMGRQPTPPHAGTRYVSVSFDSDTIFTKPLSFIYAREQGLEGKMLLHTVLVDKTLRINLRPGGRWGDAVFASVSYQRAWVSRCASQRVPLRNSGTLRHNCLFCLGMIGQQ